MGPALSGEFCGLRHCGDDDCVVLFIVVAQSVRNEVINSVHNDHLHWYSPQSNPHPSTNKHTGHSFTPTLLHGRDHVINLQHHVDVLGRLMDGAGAHEQRLDDSLLQHVADAPLLHVDSRILLSSRMTLSQLRHDADGMKTRILRQRVGNDLQRLRVRTRLLVTSLSRSHNIPISSRERLDPLLELRVDFRLGRAAAHQQEGLLHETAHDTERVMQRPLGLVEHLRERRERIAPACWSRAAARRRSCRGWRRR